MFLMTTVCKFFAKLGIEPHCCIGSLHQQNTEQAVALLADGSHSLPASRGRLARDQSQVAGDLFTVGKTSDIADGQHVSQCSHGSNAGLSHQQPCPMVLLDCHGNGLVHVINLLIQHLQQKADFRVSGFPMRRCVTSANC